MATVIAPRSTRRTATKTRSRKGRRAEILAALLAHTPATVSRRTLAAQCGLHPSHFCRVLRGERSISLPTAIRMAFVLGMETDRLIELLVELRPSAS